MNSSRGNYNGLHSNMVGGGNEPRRCLPAAIQKHEAEEDEEEAGATTSMDAEAQRTLEYLSEVEEAAEDVLATKQQVAVQLSH